MEIGIFEAKTRLSELAERAARGEIVHITKRGRPLARLVAEDPANPADNINPWQAWLDLRAAIPMRMSGQEILASIAEGRK